MNQYHRLYTPEDSAVVFIDQQPQMTSESFSGYIWPQLLDVFPRHVLRRRHRDPQAGEPGPERPRGSQVLAQSSTIFTLSFFRRPYSESELPPITKGNKNWVQGFAFSSK